MTCCNFLYARVGGASVCSPKVKKISELNPRFSKIRVTYFRCGACGRVKNFHSLLMGGVILF